MVTATAPVEMLGLVNFPAETAVLTAMRKDVVKALDVVEKLSYEDFYDPRNAVVFESIRLLLLGIEPIDTKAILAQAAVIVRDRRLKVYLDETFIESLEEGDTRRYEMYVNTVKKLAWLRKAGEFAWWLTQELQGRPKPDTLFTAAQERWQMLAPQEATSRFVYGWDTEESHDQIVRERVRRRSSGTQTRFDWPWASWNGIVRPLQPGFVGILAAADGMGKTTYLEEIAEYWAQQGLHVVYVHLEDDLDYKRDRRLARHSRVPIEKIQDGDFTEEESGQIEQAREFISGWASYLHYYDGAGESMATIVTELNARVDEGVCQVVVLDYLDKVRPSRGQLKAYEGNTWERQADDMEQLKTFVQRRRIVALTATQGNKSMQGEGTQTRRAIQGSGQKSQKAQLVVILTRDLVGPQGYVDAAGRLLAEEGEYSPIVKVRIDKQNIGRTGEFRQFLLGKYYTVRDLEVRRVPLEEVGHDGTSVPRAKDE